MKCLKFKKKFLNLNKNQFSRGLSEIKKLEPKMLPFTLIYGLVSAIHPFISIYGVSIIVDDIIGKNNIVYAHIIILVILNSLFYIINNISHDHFFNSRRVMFVKMKNYLMDIIFTLKIHNYDETRLNEICQKENTIIKHQSNNPLFMICKLLYDFIGGFTSIFLTFFLVKDIFFINNNSYFITSKYASIFVVILTIIILTIVGITSAIISKKTSKINSKIIDSLTKLDYYWDYFNNFETIKSIKIFNGINLIIDTLKSNLKENTFCFLERKSNYFAKQGALISTTGSILAFFIYLLIGIKCYNGLFTLGELTRYISGFMQIVQGGMLIANGVGQIIYLNNNLKHYFKLIDIYNDIGLNAQTKIDLSSPIKEIEFQNVYFKYDESDSYAIKNLNIKIANRQKIAIVGENGAGKTTFIKLLLGIIKPTQGKILVNGIDLNTISIDSYTKNFSTMFQDFFLPGFTINEIITGNNKQICQEKIFEASNCSQFLKNIDKTKTYLGNEYSPNGRDFSGGERQKLAFARALYKSCDFYLLDEPSSAMDAISEYNFYNSLNEYLKDKNVIYISHRLFSCIYSDRIVVFKDGSIVEDNSFELLRSSPNSLFNELWNKQTSQYVDTQICNY